MANQTVRIGTRRSPLARWQAEWVAGQLAEHDIQVELVWITTQGDVRRDSIDQIGGLGVFTKELQRALLDARVDLAVHSLKDLPTEPVEGLTVAAVPPRESVHDVLVCRQGTGLQDLPDNAVVGTGSVRRRAQLLAARPDLALRDIRGNVETRLQKLDEGQYTAIVLAEAGLRRLGLEQRITQVLPTQVMLPAVGQGALGLETRADDAVLRGLLTSLNHPPDYAAAMAERAMLATLRGGCLAPVGGWARVENSELILDGVVLSADGRQRLATQCRGALENATQIGEQAGHDLLDQGASQLLQEARSG